MKFPTFNRTATILIKGIENLYNNILPLTELETLTNFEKRQIIHASSAAQADFDNFNAAFSKCVTTDLDEEDMEQMSTLQNSMRTLYFKIRALADPYENSSEEEPKADIRATTAIKLPKLNLKTFDGTLSDWTSFINLFNSSIHNNCALSNVEKFQYLLGVVRQEPLNLIKSLAISDANYTIAYDILIKRYQNNRKLIGLHLNHILEMPTMTSYSVNALRLFLNSFTENTQALTALGCNITKDNPLLVLLILKRLDKATRTRFENQRGDQAELPTVNEIISFLESYIGHAEDATLNYEDIKPATSKTDKSKPQPVKYVSDKRKYALLVNNSTDKSNQCHYCNDGSHFLYHCKKFQLINPQERYNFVHAKNLCINCLSQLHTTKKCQSRHTCFKCGKNHHSLLHFENNPNKSQNINKNKTEADLCATAISDNKVSLVSDNNPDKIFAGISRTVASKQVLLATALVKVINPKTGTYKVLRAVLDSASHCSFITNQAAHLLGCKYFENTCEIAGISNTSTQCKGVTYLTLQSLSGELVASNHSLLILDKIVDNLPRTNLPDHIRKVAKNIILADPTFDLTSPVDLLLGAELFCLIFKGEKINLGKNLPVAYDTIFGHVLLGTYFQPNALKCQFFSLLTITNESLNNSLTKFWEQEKIPDATPINPEDADCEEYFTKTHIRDDAGRYQVRLPFKMENASSLLGDSITLAKNRFVSLEKKLNNNAEFGKLYRQFMSDYLHAGHMRLCDSNEIGQIKYFLPHHGVLKMESSTTKLRVVFDASAITSSGKSLNQLLCAGPKLQNEIFDIIVNYRLFKYVFFCDIKQMFLQINLHEDDQNYQAIIWRDNSSLPFQVFKLTTVAFGLSCSPYLAIRTLLQLAEDEGYNFPAAAAILKKNCFVDNIFGGHSEEEGLIQLQKELIQLLQKGGFELRKWASNSPQLLANLPVEYYEKPLTVTPADGPQFSVLGLLWKPNIDAFTYRVKLNDKLPTKRNILSTIAQIYDPCGFLSPVSVYTKIFMQIIWSRAIDWDDLLPDDLLEKWNSFFTELPVLTKVTVPRSFLLNSLSNLQLHGFCDASEAAYSAVIYLRTEVTNNNFVPHLLAAKTRVAPLKRVSIPRLELNAAVLLARLISYVKKIIIPHYNINSICAWSDSTVALSWIRTPAYKLQTYIANRVAEIQEIIPPQLWRHIRGSENPADCASRGLTPTQLLDNTLWWGGPLWLRCKEEDWPTSKFTPINWEDIPERKISQLSTLVATPNLEFFDFSRFSSWLKTVRIYVFVLRFINNTRNKEKYRGLITTKEMKLSTNLICKIIQQNKFKEELIKISQNKISKFKTFTPFIDSDGLLRVGGRLKHSDLSFNAKHPIIMPKVHHVTNLIIDYYHVISLHAGPQLLQSIISQKFWIISARSIMRSRIRKCNTCFRCKPANQAPLMGQLPRSRIVPSRPFTITGCDFGGPFMLKTHTLRNSKLIKAYICVFICFAVKAVHVEVATDLTAESFIAALKRFVARRGPCTEIHCDQGTNFVGANNELRAIVKSFLASQRNQEEINNFCLPHNISFHFIPAASPHMGGLWESAIKSVKYHLKRIVGETILTLEEFITLTTQIEAMLNSRPLTPLSQDIEDLSVLTPAHFLIGGNLAQVPELDLSDIAMNRLSRWELVQAFVQRIWKRWTQEYLNTLQQRLKWNAKKDNLSVGDLVIIQKENTAPFRWPMGRVTAVNTGKDNVIRSAVIKTATGELTRPAVKLFPLPTQ